VRLLRWPTQLSLSKHSNGNDNLLGNGDLLLNCSIQIDFRSWCANRHHQAVARRQLVALQCRPRPPPTRRRVNSNESAGGQLCGRTDLYILMKRAAMPLPLSQVPIRIRRIHRVALIVALCRGIHPGHEIVG